MSNVIANGLNGLLNQQARVNGFAGRIAGAAAGVNVPAAAAAGPSAVVSLSNPETLPVDHLHADLIGMKEATLIYKANAKTLEVADEMLGTLLETKG